MKYDVFFSISQTEVEGYTPSPQKMFQNFFDQVRLADDLEMETAWLAETHLSCQSQKKTSLAVVKDFKGEIGLNSDILQMAPLVFSQTKKINAGSAIRNILCNGGPVAHAELLQNYMALQQESPFASRKIELGFAAGRFDFSNAPYGIFPRNDFEKNFWFLIKGRVFRQASQIFLSLLKGKEVSSKQAPPVILKALDFRSSEDWDKAQKLIAGLKEAGAYRVSAGQDQIAVPPFFDFEALSLIPLNPDYSKLQLTLASQDPETQKLCNEYFPVRLFNLSITPEKVIEENHKRMSEIYNSAGGPWKREYMPRTLMLFIDDSGRDEVEKEERARAKASRAWENYWKAMAGTIDPQKIEQAVDNAVFGSPEKIAEKILKKYHPQERLMLWFDFNNHDNEDVKKSMRLFMERSQKVIQEGL